MYTILIFQFFTIFVTTQLCKYRTSSVTYKNSPQHVFYILIKDTNGFTEEAFKSLKKFQHLKSFKIGILFPRQQIRIQFQNKNSKLSYKHYQPLILSSLVIILTKIESCSFNNLNSFQYVESMINLECFQLSKMFFIFQIILN